MNIELMKKTAQGKWKSIFSHFGIEVTEKHQPCPLCGGKDRFIFTDKFNSGNYYCNQCGPGDGIGLIQKFTGMEFKECVRKIAGFIGYADKDERTDISEDKIKNMLNLIWKDSVKLKGHDPVLKYLHSRKIVIRPDDVRFNSKCYHSETKKSYQAMVAMVRNKNGKPICLHRTYLNGTGKADIENNRKNTPSVLQLSGSAIRLNMPGDTIFKDDTLGVAEGIETALSASQIFGVATWSVMNTSIMESFEPPEHIRKIIIFADNDNNYAGQKSAYILANKLALKDLIVRVEVPENGDWNDILMSS